MHGLNQLGDRGGAVQDGDRAAGVVVDLLAWVDAQVPPLPLQILTGLEFVSANVRGVPVRR